MSVALYRHKGRSFLRKSLQVIGVFALGTAQSGCWEGTSRDVQATVLAVDGPAAMSPNVRGRFVPLAPGAHPGEGEILETTGSARAAIALLPNLLVQLDRDARLEIVRLAITKDGNETGAAMQARYADVKLLSGRMFASHVWGEAIAKFTVTTSHGRVVTTSNALFCVEVDEHKTRVTCVSGSIGWQADNAAGVTRIPPGFVGEWSASNSALGAAESDERAQESLLEGLEIEEKLRQLTIEKHYVLPR